jgi:hypothetical protein
MDRMDEERTERDRDRDERDRVERDRQEREIERDRTEDEKIARRVERDEGHEDVRDDRPEDVRDDRPEDVPVRKSTTTRRRSTRRSREEERESAIGDLAEGWPKMARKAVEEMLEKYGDPDEITPTRLVWFDQGPWKRTVVSRDEVPHAFPKPHVDVLEQWIDYRVPIEKVGNVVAFDGSVIVDRTKGEVAARCDSEEMNILTLNLVHEISMGKRSVEDARKLFAETAAAFMMNRSAPYIEKLRFVSERETADADESMMTGAMFHQTVEKVKDVFRRTEHGPQ